MGRNLTRGIADVRRKGLSPDTSPTYAVRLPLAVKADIEKWARAEGISRSEAIRRLVERGLASEVKE
jgi:hypothetical protein